MDKKCGGVEYLRYLGTEGKENEFSLETKYVILLLYIFMTKVLGRNNHLNLQPFLLLLGLLLGLALLLGAIFGDKVWDELQALNFFTTLVSEICTEGYTGL